MFQISWAIAICPVKSTIYGVRCSFFRWANTRPTVSWRAGALEGFGSRTCSRLRMVVMLRNFQNGKEAICIDEKHKTYMNMIQYVHLARNFALSQGIFNPSRSSWCKPDENMKLAGMEASEPREKEWKSTSIQVHFETNLEPCKAYLKVANHKILSLPCSKLESHGISSISGLGNQRQPDACRGVQTARRFSSVLRHTGYSGTQTTSSFHNVMTKQPNNQTSQPGAR